MFLADFGAEVIKVEEPEQGDYTRWNDPKINENSAVFHSLNRNKKSITLNLKSNQGKEVFRKLVESADVVIESFRPGVMKRLGLGYEELKELNPKLIYCAITGFGQEGLSKLRRLIRIQGHFNEPPVLSAIQLADIGGGSQMATIGILLALQARNQTGEGQFVDISMTDGIISWMQSMLPEYFISKKLPERGKLRLGGEKACYFVYETANNRYLSVGALEEKFWKVFCTEIDCPHLISRLNAPFEEQQQMKEDIAAVIKKNTLSEWCLSLKEKMPVFAYFKPGGSHRGPTGKTSKYDCRRESYP
jgi:crotonobetainyl-CoA:carnitine CoA-transferase CaiB-like acyl-CoA transferase